MIFRVAHRSTAYSDPAPSAWEVFRATQESLAEAIGLVSQPAHAALAGRIAAALQATAFGELPAEVVEIIGRHDIGWAEADLAGLESADRVPPISFLAYPVPGAVDAWRRSIRAAERRSPLTGILTSRHFCLLASPDDPLHVVFEDEESKRRELNEGACSVPGSDLDRFERALGFCDLLSLCLCSGSREAVRLSLAHPADLPPPMRSRSP